MFKSKTVQINHISQMLNENNSFSKLMNSCREIENINKIISSQIPSLANVCRCGAIDYNESTIVLFCQDNASFYRVNNLMSEIEECLSDSKFFFDKILVKLVPNIETQHKQESKKIDKRLYPAMEKIIATLELDYKIDYHDNASDKQPNQDDDDLIKL